MQACCAHPSVSGVCRRDGFFGAEEADHVSPTGQEAHASTAGSGATAEVAAI